LIWIGNLPLLKICVKYKQPIINYERTIYCSKVYTTQGVPQRLQKKYWKNTTLGLHFYPSRAMLLRTIEVFYNPRLYLFFLTIIANFVFDLNVADSLWHTLYTFTHLYMILKMVVIVLIVLLSLIPSFQPFIVTIQYWWTRTTTYDIKPTQWFPSWSFETKHRDFISKV